MKKLICMLLCLMLPLTALAAPMRDMRASVLSEAELSTMRAWLDQQVRAALPVDYDENTYVGAYVYSCVEDGGCYVLECDVYLEDGGDSLPLYAAEEALVWLCDATVCVKRAGSGYEMVSCEVGEYYAAQEYVWTENDNWGYALNLPDIYAVNAGDVYDYSCYDKDGAFVSGIRYRFEETGGETLESYAQSLSGESEGDVIVTEYEELPQITAQSSGMYLIVYEGEDGFHSLTITYPEDREAEFTLYGEFLRNSFTVEGQSNG